MLSICLFWTYGGQNGGRDKSVGLSQIGVIKVGIWWVVNLVKLC